MTRVIDILSRAARQVSVAAPSSWITATSDEHVELRDDFLRQTVEDAIKRVDWPAPISAETTIAGDGSTTYDLPTNFKRLHRDEWAVHDGTFTRYTCPVARDSDWALIEANGLAGIDRIYRVTGYDGNFGISFLPVISTDLTVHYVTTYWLVTSGSPGGTLMDDEDICLLPDDLVEAGIIWRWRERRGLPYQDKMAEYEMLMSRHMSDRKGIRSVSMGPKRKVRWQDNVPAYIPPAP